MIKSAIFDSGRFIGVKHKSDQWHDKSLSILNAFAERKIKEIFISNYVILEIVNFLLRKTDYTTAIESYNYLLNASRIKVVYIDEIISIAIKELFVEIDLIFQ